MEFLGYIGRPRAGKDYTAEQHTKNGYIVRYADPIKKMSAVIFDRFGNDHDIKEQVFFIERSDFLAKNHLIGQGIVGELLKEFYTAQLSEININSFIQKKANPQFTFNVAFWEHAECGITIDLLKGEVDFSANKLGAVFSSALEQAFAKHLTEENGIKGYKISPRLYQQYIGTNVFREYVHYDFWVKIGLSRALKQDQGVDIVSPDIRFPNELTGFINTAKRNNLDNTIYYVLRPSKDNLELLSKDDFMKLHGSEVFQEMVREQLIRSVQEMMDKTIQAGGLSSHQTLAQYLPTFNNTGFVVDITKHPLFNEFSFPPESVEKFTAKLIVNVENA